MRNVAMFSAVILSAAGAACGPDGGGGGSGGCGGAGALCTTTMTTTSSTNTTSTSSTTSSCRTCSQMVANADPVVAHACPGPATDLLVSVLACICQSDVCGSADAGADNCAAECTAPGTLISAGCQACDQKAAAGPCGAEMAACVAN